MKIIRELNALYTDINQGIYRLPHKSAKGMYLQKYTLAKTGFKRPRDITLLRFKVDHYLPVMALVYMLLIAAPDISHISTISSNLAYSGCFPIITL